MQLLEVPRAAGFALLVPSVAAGPPVATGLTPLGPSEAAGPPIATGFTLLGPSEAAGLLPHLAHTPIPRDPAEVPPQADTPISREPAGALPPDCADHPGAPRGPAGECWLDRCAQG